LGRVSVRRARLGGRVSWCTAWRELGIRPPETDFTGGMEGAHRRAPLEEPFEASRGWWCRRGTSRLIAALLLTLFVGSARAQSWCQDSEFDISKHDICLQPSIGPDTGGTPLIIKGFNDIIYPDWPTQCQFPERWTCIFGSDAPSIPAVSVDCGSGFVKCVTPPNVSPSDPEARLPFDVLMNVVITGETQSQIFPRLGREPVHFAFFGGTQSQTRICPAVFTSAVYAASLDHLGSSWRCDFLFHWQM
jgi:hypothetical protein